MDGFAVSPEAINPSSNVALQYAEYSWPLAWALGQSSLELFDAWTKFPSTQINFLATQSLDDVQNHPTLLMATIYSSWLSDGDDQTKNLMRIDRLLSAGADPMITNAKGETSFAYATRIGATGALQILSKHGVNH